MTTDQRVGTAVGDYVIQDILGRGGMGVVYRARHRVEGRVVALKLMLPELAANEDFRDRFIREAEFAPSLDHPNIVPVYETGEIAGELFIAMHLVDGCDLKMLIKREGPLAPRRALSILAQAASALDAAHEMVVVHRDVKPQNIMISPGEGPDPRDLVFLTDFGLIRPAASESTASRTGQIFGSIQYMAPEQIEGLPADGRADVYSLACVAYECFTGTIPFERPNEIGAIWAHIHEEPPRVSQVRPELPGGIDDVIRQGMAKHPDDRYLTCGELVTELEEGLKKQRRQLVPTPLRPLVQRISRPKTEREIWAPNFFPELSRVRKLTNRTNWAQTFAVTGILLLSATGFVHFAHDGGITQAVADVASGVTETVQDMIPGAPDEEGADVASVSSAGPDPRDDEAARADRSKLRLAAAKDGSKGSPRSAAVAEVGPQSKLEPRQPSDASRAAQAAMDHAIIFDAPRPWWDGGSALFTMRPDGSKVRLFYNSDQQEYDAVWSPDGSRVAFIRGDSLYVINADGTGTRQLVAAGASREPSWSPDGTRIVFAHNPVNDWDIYVVPASEGGVAVPTRVVSGAGEDRDPDWSPDGSKILFTSSRNGTQRLHTVDSDGSNLRVFAPAPSGSSAATWSPDGKRVAYVVTRTNGSVIQVVDQASGATTSVGCGGECANPAWSPSGKALIFTARAARAITPSLYSVRLKRPSDTAVLALDVRPTTRGDWR